MRDAWFVGLLALAGCSIDLERRVPIAAAPDDAPNIDAAACGPVMDTIESCGTSCQRCEAPSERSTPTCDGTACGYSCNNRLACTDSSCSRTRWQFDSLTTDDVTPHYPPDLRLTVRQRDGNPALAMDVAFTDTVSRVAFTFPVCLSGTLDASALTLTFRLFFDPPLNDTSFWADAYIGEGVSGSGLGTGVLQGSSWNSFSFPISKSSVDNKVTTVTIDAGPFGFSYNGTLWFDDFKIL